ncbi:protein kinase [Candidatus Uabimicrobium sp. HlEnr_7]|uniref:protein kinase domain-containing protein n=1 Tax=Candidatus Uabimicrobium helgolandensis TaxID=3095367 RepID=UPI003558EB6C
MEEFHPENLGNVFHLQPGQDIGNYNILSEISRGGMGIVFKAIEKNSERIVAIKIIFQNQSKIAKRRFLREAEVAAKLHHSNIAQVYNAGAVDSNLYLVMEYVEGVTLDDWLENRDCSIRDAVNITLQIANALSYAHRKKVVHRDVKPQNIIIQRDGTAKIMDFGLAKSVHVGDYSLTKTGDIIGTPRYMAPELFKSSRTREINYQADIYSLGAIFYELLSGQYMMPGQTPMEIIFNVEGFELISLKNYVEELPDDLDIIQRRSVAPKTQRYENMELFSHDLQCFLQGKRIGTKLPFAWNKLYIPVAIISTIFFAFVLYRMIFSTQQAEIVDVDNSYFEGAVAFENKQYEKAFDLFKSLDKTRPILLFYLGASLYERGEVKQKFTGKNDDSKQAIVYLKKAYKKIPQHLETNYYLSKIFRQKQDYLQAKRHLQKCIDIAPNDPLYYIDFADVCFQIIKDNPKAASLCFENLRKALNLDPGNLRAANLLFNLSVVAPHFQASNWSLLDQMFFSLNHIKRPLLFKSNAQKTKVKTYPKYIEGLIKLDKRTEDFYLYLAATSYLKSKFISQGIKGIDSFQKILLNTKKDSFLRFLAARSLGELGKFELLALHFNEMHRKKDIVGKIIIGNILTSHQIPVDMKKVLRNLQEIFSSKDSLLMTLVGQCCYTFHTEFSKPKRADEEVKSILFQLMDKQMPSVARLAASASAFAFSNVNNDLAEKGFEVIKTFLSDKNPIIRQYAYCYIWNSWDGRRNKDSYILLYKKGLNDSNEDVNMMCLSFFNKYMSNQPIAKIANDLRRLGKKKESPELSLRALCLWNISMPPVEDVILLFEKDKQMSPLTKCMITRFFLICQYQSLRRNMRFSTPGIQEMLSYIANSQDYAFQSNMYFLMAFYSPRMVMQEQQRHSTTQAARINGLGYSVGRRGSRLKDVLSNYLYEPQGTLRQVTNAAMVTLSGEEERKKYYNSLQNSQDSFVLLGASQGFRRLVQLRMRLYDLSFSATRQSMRKATRPQRYQPYLFEKQQHKYETFLTKSTKNIRDNLNDLNMAKKLYKRSEYFYEEALILIAGKRWSDAKRSLKDAININEHFHKAKITLAELLYQEGRKREAFSLIKEIATKIRDPFLQKKLAQLYVKLGKYLHAESIYKRLWTFNSYNKDVLLDIVRVFCLQQKQQEALQYVNWGSKILERKYVKTNSYDDILSQSDFEEQDFYFIRKTPSIRNLPE